MPVFRPIQIIPPGLLGAFQLKQEGRGIVELLDQLSPTLDLLRWYLQARAQTSRQAHGVNLATGRASFTAFSPLSIAVPSNEAWYVHHYGVRVACGDAADVVEEFHLAWVDTAVGTLFPQVLNESTVQTGNTVNGANGVLVSAAHDFFVPPGSTLGFGHAVTSAGSTITTTGFIRFTPLPI